MALWVILVVAGVLVVAALVLVIAVHILDVHAEQRCAHLRDRSQRPLQQNQDQTRYQYRCGESQLCCMCGSVRNRRCSQVSNGNNSSSLAKNNPRQSTAGGLLQPLVDAACGRSSLSSGSLECLSGLTNRRKHMASGFQGRWFNRRSFFGGNVTPEETRAKGRIDDSRGSIPGAAAVIATSASSTSPAAFASTSRMTAGSESDSTTTFTISTTNKSSNSSTSSTDAKISSSTASNDGDYCKPIPQRRFVLEILMSASNTGDGQGGVLPKATGVRLKFETSSGVESICQPNEKDDAEVVAQALTTGLSTASVPAGEICTGNIHNYFGTNGATCAVPSLKEGYIQPEQDFIQLPTRTSDKYDSVSQERSTASCVLSMVAKASTVRADNDSGAVQCGKSAGQSICPSTLDKRTAGFGFPGLVSANPLPSVACKTRSNGNMLGATTSAKAKAKMGTCSSNSNLCTGHVTPGCSTNGCPTPLSLKGPQSQGSFSTPLDGLGSLRISILDGSSKGKSIKECSKGVTAEIASALAALNVDSIGGKGVGMNLTLGQAGDSSDTVCLSEKMDVVHEEEVTGDGSGSEKVMEEGDDRHPRSEIPEEDEIDGNKKEKRKKKNKGRRQKAKAAAVAAAAAGIEAQAQEHVTGYHAIETVETSSMIIESEVGCICGIPKGACHYNNCPYPFTSSGSMVQRKIKEKYDELVRSNIAKTLTLAQVGRFTTCLVEAKSALQQKSDTIQRRFTIAKSLLSKADKSSFDRLCGQIYGLEIEQKKLEEDTVVYNRLQEQLKLSPAYQKMLEYGRTHFELQPNTGQLIEKVDSNEISFEDLLAQEKKDSFWQKHGLPRTSMQVN